MGIISKVISSYERDIITNFFSAEIFTWHITFVIFKIWLLSSRLAWCHLGKEETGKR